MDDLYKLIRKELIFFKGTMRMQFIISLLFVMIFPLMSPSFIFMGSIIIPYFAIYGAMAYEEKSRGEVLMATLPVSRKAICFSKYVLGMIYSILGILISMICLAMGQMFLPAHTIRQLILSNVAEVSLMMMATSMIYIAIMLPILLRFGTEKSRYIMFLLYIGTFALSSALGSILGEIGGTGILVAMMGTATGVALLGVVLYILSITLATKIIANKEF